MLKRKTLIKLGVLVIAVTMAISVLAISLITASANPADETNPNYTLIIESPYRYVNWARVGQYRAAMHAHTSRSDGAGYMSDHLKVFYNKGYDIVTLADHDVLCNGDWTREYIHPDYVRYFANSWTRETEPNGMFALPGRLDEATNRAIRNGTRRTRFENDEFAWSGHQSNYTGFRTQSNGMISIPYSIEQSQRFHTLTYFAPFTRETDYSQEDVIRRAQELGGLSVMSHPGRYTGGNNTGDPELGAHNATRAQTINRYLPLFMEYDSLMGFEIFNRLDGESFSDRLMWDELLQHTMPYGRNIFGFGNDDSHRVDQIGWNWNVMLMNNLNVEDFRTSMESGAFYVVARVSRRDGINTYITNENDPLGYGRPTPIVPDIHTMYKLYQTTPGIDEITAAHGVITITGRDYDRIEWIANGEVIHTGNEFILEEHEGTFGEGVGYYVRAQVRSDYGIAMTQPFGIRMGIEPPEVNFNIGGLSTEMIYLIVIIGSLVLSVVLLVVAVVVIKKRRVS